MKIDQFPIILTYQITIFSAMTKFIKWFIKTLLVIAGIFPLLKCSSGYEKKNGKITFNGKEITDRNFMVLNEVFAKDSSTAYYKEHPFRSADVATFIAVDNHYAKDKNKVYYCDEYREGQNYYLTKKQTIEVVHDAIPASFKSIEYGYAKDEFRAYYKGIAFTVKDVASLQSINTYFVKDDVQAYINRNPIAGSNGNTFTIMNNNYAKDTAHIYFYITSGEYDQLIHRIECHRNTFEILDYPYAKDQGAVYFEGKNIEEADPVTLKLLSHGYATDKTNVFKGAKKITSADALSFVVYKENDSFNDEFIYTKDNTSVFYNDKKLIGVDLATFKPLGNNYGCDNKHVFYKTAIMKNAQPANFKVYPHDIGDADAEDKMNKYNQGKRVQ